MIGALVGAAIVGAALGFLGSGGSILTVPILIYGLGMPEKTAIASSLVIVGSIALVGTVLQARRGAIIPRCLAAFGLPGIGGALAGGTLGGWAPASLQLGVFLLVTLSAAIMMLRPQEPTPSDERVRMDRVAMAGAGVGAVTGFVGVGGGFLLVPALQRFAQLRLAAAVGTSLALVTLNAAVGFLGQWFAGAATVIPIATVTPFAVVGILGLLVGQFGGTCLAATTRRATFASVLLVVSAFTAVQIAHTSTDDSGAGSSGPIHHPGSADRIDHASDPTGSTLNNELVMRVHKP